VKSVPSRACVIGFKLANQSNISFIVSLDVY
jgi:hypothetical protein